MEKLWSNYGGSREKGGWNRENGTVAEHALCLLLGTDYADFTVLIYRFRDYTLMK